MQFTKLLLAALVGLSCLTLQVDAKAITTSSQAHQIAAIPMDKRNLLSPVDTLAGPEAKTSRQLQSRRRRRRRRYSRAYLRRLRRYRRRMRRRFYRRYFQRLANRRRRRRQAQLRMRQQTPPAPEQAPAAQPAPAVQPAAPALPEAKVEAQQATPEVDTPAVAPCPKGMRMA